MVKHYCDICQKEFQPYNLMNGERAFSNFNHYEMSNMVSKEQPTPQLKVSALMICPDCGRTLKEKADSMIKENETKTKD
jgi:protein-arginine kinase activator protein McsA